MQKRVFLLMGSNLGDRQDNLDRAMDWISLHAGSIISRSSVYETEPWGFASSRWFLNQALEIETTLSPLALLETVQRAEAEMGRRMPSGIYESRIIDIDILLYGRLVMQENKLVIPHPRFHLRRFSLEPLNEIAPEVFHPVLQKKVSALLSACDDPCVVNILPLQSIPSSAKL